MVTCAQIVVRVDLVLSSSSFRYIILRVARFVLVTILLAIIFSCALFWMLPGHAYNLLHSATRIWFSHIVSSTSIFAHNVKSRGLSRSGCYITGVLFKKTIHTHRARTRTCTNMHAHTYTHARTHARSLARSLARTHTNTHTHTRTHTHKHTMICVSIDHVFMLSYCLLQFGTFTPDDPDTNAVASRIDTGWTISGRLLWYNTCLQRPLQSSTIARLITDIQA